MSDEHKDWIHVFSGSAGARVNTHTGEIHGLYTIKRNPFFKKLMVDLPLPPVHEVCRAHERMPGWHIGETDRGNIGLFLGSDIRLAFTAAGKMWQALGQFEGEGGILSDPGPGYVDGDPKAPQTDFPEIYYPILDETTITTFGDWAFAEVLSGGWLAFTSTQEGSSQRIANFMISDEGRIWSRFHAGYLRGSRPEPYEADVPSVGYLQCNATKIGAWFMGRSSDGQFIITRGAQLHVSVFADGRVWTRGSGMLRMAGEHSNRLGDLSRELEGRPFQWPSNDIMPSMVTKVLPSCAGGAPCLECEELWHALPQKLWHQWSSARSLLSDSMIETRQYCIHDITWQIEVLMRTTISRATAFDSRYESRVTKEVLCHTATGGNWEPQRTCCTKKRSEYRGISIPEHAVVASNLISL